MIVTTGVSAQQLTGSADAYGAWKFNNGHKQNVGFNLNYDSTLYYIHAGMRGYHDRSLTGECTNILNESDEGRNFSLKTDTSNIATREWGIGANFDFGYHLSSHDLLTINMQYSYDNLQETEHNISRHYQANIDAEMHAFLDTIYGNQNDRTLTNRHDLRAAIDYRHQFSETNSLTLSFITKHILGSEARKRELSGKMYADSRNITATDILGESYYQVSLHYDDKQLAGVENLKMKAGIDIFADNDDDHYRADFNDPDRDTTYLNYFRSYLLLYAEPFIRLEYKYQNWDFSLMERPQIYSNLQWDMLAAKTPKRIYHHTQYNNLAKANIGYLLQDRHRFDLSYSYDVLHPDYKKFSPVMRLTDDEGEYLQGNDSLRPEKLHKVNFRYSYRKDEHILTTLDVYYGNKKDKIEKVVIVNETKNKQIETLKTYVNDNLQHQLGTMLRLRLNYQSLEAEAWSGMAWERFTYYNGKKPKDEISYQLGLMLNAHLNQWVDLASTMVYISPTSSAYNEKNEYIGANLRLTVNTPVGVKVFIETNDIINKPKTETTWNESMTYMKVKEEYQNRSCLGLGVRYEW